MLTMLSMIKHHIKQSQAHLREVNMTYLEHMIFSFRFAKQFMNVSCNAIIHGCMPSLHKTSSTDFIHQLCEDEKDTNQEDVKDEDYKKVKKVKKVKTVSQQQHI